MNVGQKGLLWLSQDKTNCYFLPEDFSWPTGQQVLISLAGEEKTVEATAVAPYLVPAEKAQTLLETQKSAALEEAQQAFSQFLAYQKAQENLTPPSPESQSPPKPSQLVVDLLGFTPDELRQNPDLAQKSLENIWQNLQGFIQSVTSEDPEQLTTAQTQIASLKGILTQNGVPLNDEFDQLPQKIRQAYWVDHQERLQRNAVSLQLLAEKIKETAVAVSAQLEAQASEWQNQGSKQPDKPIK